MLTSNWTGAGHTPFSGKIESGENVKSTAWVGIEKSGSDALRLSLGTGSQAKISGCFSHKSLVSLGCLLFFPSVSLFPSFSLSVSSFSLWGGLARGASGLSGLRSGRGGDGLSDFAFNTGCAWIVGGLPPILFG